MSLNDTVPAMLEEMAATFKERNTTYRDNYLIVGQMLAALYPDGITLKTPEDFIRFHLVDWTIGKLSRWANTGMDHEDSIKDAAVYTTMLAAWTRDKA
jgi:hypothetical protein